MSLALQKKWAEIISDFEANVTFIRGRPVFHMIFDVTAHSVLGFNFKGKPVRRGFLDTFIIGDTSIGKSEVAATLSEHYNIPRPFRCENVSLAGLVGGVQQNSGGHNMLTWGLLPRMDKRMVTLEEFSSVSLEIIANMSDVRSSGVASITKISGGETMARVRKLHIANPRRQGHKGDIDVTVDQFAFGVMAVPQVIGLPEDVRRFDLGTIGNVKEVPASVINDKAPKKVKHRYTAEAAHALIMWAWSRRPEHVVFQAGVEDRCIDLALEMTSRYSPDIPLVEPGEQRFKVARVAVALAARFHSTDKTGQQVVVKKEHVDLSDWLFRQCYDSEACNYVGYSKGEAGKKEAALSAADYEAILGSLGAGNAAVLLDAIAFAEDLGRIQVVDFKDQATMLRKLVAMGLIRQTPKGMVKTPKFMAFYKLFSEKSLKKGK